MSLFTQEVETRDLTWSDVYGAATPSQIGPDGVLRLAPVYSAVGLIADQFATAKVGVEEERGDGSDPIALPDFLRDPDPFLDPIDWKFQLVTSLKLRGNAYGLTDPARRYVRWLHPDWVTVTETRALNPVYRLFGKQIDPVKRGGSLVHVREFVQPGSVLGLSPIKQFMADFDQAGLARDFGRKWFRNAAVPPSILSAKDARIPAARLKEARDDFIEATKDGKPVALPGEWNWQKVTLTAEEAQFLNTIKASATTIASIFRVNPEDIGGEVGSSRTYGNREADAERFIVRTLFPLGQRVAEGLGNLLPPGQSIRFDFDGLAQPGQLESARADTEELRNGTLTLPEARRRRGRRPLTEREVEDWQAWYSTQKSQSEAIAESVSTSITKEA